LANQCQANGENRNALKVFYFSAAFSAAVLASAAIFGASRWSSLDSRCSTRLPVS
jgi:hypothetical protein